MSASREEEEDEDYGISNLLLDEVQNVTLVKQKMCKIANLDVFAVLVGFVFAAAILVSIVFTCGEAVRS